MQVARGEAAAGGGAQRRRRCSTGRNPRPARNPLGAAKAQAGVQARQQRPRRAVRQLAPFDLKTRTLHSKQSRTLAARSLSGDDIPSASWLCAPLPRRVSSSESGASLVAASANAVGGMAMRRSVAGDGRSGCAGAQAARQPRERRAAGPGRRRSGCMDAGAAWPRLGAAGAPAEAFAGRVRVGSNGCRDRGPRPRSGQHWARADRGFTQCKQLLEVT